MSVKKRKAIMMMRRRMGACELSFIENLRRGVARHQSRETPKKEYGWRGGLMCMSDRQGCVERIIEP